MIEVEVRLYATLRRYRPSLAAGEPLILKLDDNATVETLLAELNIPEEEIKVVIVNGRRREETFLLRDGDRVGIFPPVGGG